MAMRGHRASRHLKCSQTQRTSMCFHAFLAGKRSPDTPLLQRGTFLRRQKWGPLRKDLSGRYGFPGFGFLYLPLAWKALFGGQKSFPKAILSVMVVYVFLFPAFSF